MTTDQPTSTAVAGQQATKPDRPTYIGIHTRDETTQVLYVSSGCRQGVGFTPEYVMKQRAKDFIADEFDSNDYASVYASRETTNPFTEEEEDEDEANAYIMYVNLKSASGTPILTRVTSFKCDNCVIYVGMAFPEIPYSNRRELEVQMLDGAMKRLNVTREREMKIEARRQLASDPNTRTPLYYARSKQVKAAFVLENPEVTGVELQETGRRPTGPLIAFVTGSVSRLIDADTSDLMSYPFLKLVAPEDVLHVSKYFDRLGESTDVMFENFSLLNRPHIIEGDIFVSDEENTRIVVECLGAAVQDGVALLLRMVRSQPPPRRDSEGNYIRTSSQDIDGNGGYVSLSELISSDPDTSDAPGWSKLR
ncbi:hypothetical protein H4R20_001011 [Coemansia guatemalensis]|uniref:PAS domain-containing protein n=1 Tax=Coemansia guatemalensis TaxID=2761395 RepID=A0A9W8I054_9FUNG|nr:hypothetical protein H4R20_001011 [Coemansia guatemalensis]